MQYSNPPPRSATDTVRSAGLDYSNTSEQEEQHTHEGDISMESISKSLRDTLNNGGETQVGNIVII